MGYPVLNRMALAVVSAALNGGAFAGAIEGTVTFPSQLLPSMTVYVSDLDTSRVRSAQLTRGNAKFTIDVPAGRYWVFLAPNEPGAPNIYGAYTQYSLCAHLAIDPCEDHTLMAVTISAKTPRTTVTVDDWYLTDDIAEQIDAIRAAAAGANAPGNSEPMGAPRFSEYPSERFNPTPAPRIELGDGDLSDKDRTSLTLALASGPNFAGHVTAAVINCGDACARLLFVDWNKGAVRELPHQDSIADIHGDLPCRGAEALLFRRDSRLLRISRAQGEAVVTQYYLWDQENATLVRSSEYRRELRTFCADAAR
ncbi:MAG: hypothetical protein M3N50_04470 [Pseudomonadota bacterium]|nr:hypothetical protein [Pseudomonadota bacterium]